MNILLTASVPLWKNIPLLAGFAFVIILSVYAFVFKKKTLTQPASTENADIAWYHKYRASMNTPEGRRILTNFVVIGVYCALLFGISQMRYVPLWRNWMDSFGVFLASQFLFVAFVLIPTFYPKMRYIQTGTVMHAIPGSHQELRRTMRFICFVGGFVLLGFASWHHETKTSSSPMMAARVYTSEAKNGTFPIYPKEKHPGIVTIIRTPVAGDSFAVAPKNDIIWIAYGGMQPFKVNREAVFGPRDVLEVWPYNPKQKEVTEVVVQSFR